MFPESMGAMHMGPCAMMRPRDTAGAATPAGDVTVPLYKLVDFRYNKAEAGYGALHISQSYVKSAFRPWRQLGCEGAALPSGGVQ